jgi:hypothetical protein
MVTGRLVGETGDVAANAHPPGSRCCRHGIDVLQPCLVEVGSDGTCQPAVARYAMASISRADGVPTGHRAERVRSLAGNIAAQLAAAAMNRPGDLGDSDHSAPAGADGTWC